MTRSHLVAFGCGIVFAIGLVVSHMTDPHKVLAFLDVTGDWDPSLAFVMGSAIAVYAPAWRYYRRNGTPADTLFTIPSRRIDAKVVIGGILFGLGWGLVGFCPGPAIVSLPTLAPSVLITVGSMIAGMVGFRLISGRG